MKSSYQAPLSVGDSGLVLIMYAVSVIHRRQAGTDEGVQIMQQCRLSIAPSPLEPSQALQSPWGCTSTPHHQALFST